jgi:hypothetical protein
VTRGFLQTLLATRVENALARKLLTGCCARDFELTQTRRCFAAPKKNPDVQ